MGTKGGQMSQYIQCNRCKNFTIEVIGDQELGCEFCSDQYSNDGEEND